VIVAHPLWLVGSLFFAAASGRLLLAALDVGKPSAFMAWLSAAAFVYWTAVSAIYFFSGTP
jgi:hypothetical protein